LSDDLQFYVNVPTPVTPDKLDAALCALGEVAGFPEHTSTLIQSGVDGSRFSAIHPVP
ncbi:hypothetical protein LCGC14_2863820, partial [marine sediment metagenome]